VYGGAFARRVGGALQFAGLERRIWPRLFAGWAREVGVKRSRLLGVVALIGGIGIAIGYAVFGDGDEGSRRLTPGTPEAGRLGDRHAVTRYMLFEALKPVKLANCEFARFGEQHDGGYAMCANLLSSVETGYSYGISNYDQWGCDIATKLDVPVHQYDCFDTRQPACPAGKTIFHPECVSAEPFTEDGRPFDTLASHFLRNGDGGKRVVVKMDVEGAEWDSLLFAPDEVLEQIDQLVLELHGVDDGKYAAVAQRLNRFFHVANVHFNNFVCQEGIEPFPAWAYEVLFVNRRIGVPDPSGAAPSPAAVDAPNQPELVDCQEWRLEAGRPGALR
jgi:hypothetical protein